MHGIQKCGDNTNKDSKIMFIEVSNKASSVDRDATVDCVLFIMLLR